MFDTVISDIILVHKCEFTIDKFDKVYADGRGMDGFVYAVSGSAEWIFEDKITTLSQGDIIYLPSSSKYCVKCKDAPFVHYTVNFITETPIAQKAAKLAPKDTFLYKKLFEKLTDVWTGKKSGFRLKSKALLYDLIYEFYNSMSFAGINMDSFDKILPAKEYIESHPFNNITIGELAEICNLSETHFRRLFNEIYETSPLDYQISLKLMKAEDLLLTKLYTINEVARLCGFSDANYFSRIFKAKKGISPLKFKASR